MYATLSLFDFLLHRSKILLQYQLMHESIIVSCYNILLLSLPIAHVHRCYKISGYMESKDFSGCKIKFIEERFRFVWFMFRPVTSVFPLAILYLA